VKLRAIELTNLRRFAGRRASLTQIGDGVTVLSEPNEFGKSTFFDALHALFFERHRSTKAPVKALQPHSGGAPEVAVEIDLPEGRFRLSKRWLSRPQARVADATGRIIAQDDEAEAWIDRLLDGDLAGPSGLLWVRQGLLGLEPQGGGAQEKNERERGLAARRDLMSSVAGEIDSLTGGRRMDAVLDRVLGDLGRLATDGGKPKAGGDWKRAVDEAAALATHEADLRPKAERLSGDLARRVEVQRALARLADPTEAAARADGLQRARADHQAAEAHQAQVQQAEAALHLAGLDAETAAREVARLHGLSQRVEQARAALAAADLLAETARTRATETAARDRAASDAASAAAQTARDLRVRLKQADRAQRALAAQAQIAVLRRRLDRLTALQTDLDADLALRARLTVTDKSLAAAEQAQSLLDQLQARATAQAVTVEARPEGPAASVEGTPLPPGPQPILSPTLIILPGFGTLRIDPGHAQRSDLASDTARATADLHRALAACSVTTLPLARAAKAKAQRLDAAIDRARSLIHEIAPDGADALRQSLARAEADGDDVPEHSEDPVALTDALSAAEVTEAEARAAAAPAHAVAIAAGEARAQAEGERTTAGRRLTEALAEAGDLAALSALLVDAKGRLPGLQATRDRAHTALRSLRAAAPDLATTSAALTRAQSRVDQAARDEAMLREERTQLNTRIEVLAEEGVEERLNDLAGARAEATARAARYEAEVRSLTRLRRALDQARVEAREAYFGPVLRELQPLLAILHPGALLSIDDSSLLPHILTRDGQPEPLDILSGGTREQLAILTRLAFARLFAAAGRAVPVILDDALVHSDDDRIEAMFTALHRVAQDQQVLVLTCRQRAFAALGGARAQVRIDMI
jgi:hypothetical protein